MKYMGLKEFKISLKHAPLEQVLEEAMETACDPTYDCIWGAQDSWAHFCWAFGQAWRNHYREQMARVGLSGDLRKLSKAIRLDCTMSKDLRAMASAVLRMSAASLRELQIAMVHGDIAATFPIGHVLSKKMLERVALTVGISEPYVPETYT